MFVTNDSDASTDIANFCSNNASYIIEVRNSLQHTINLECEEESPISVTIKNDGQYALKVAPSSEKILNNKLASNAIDVSIMEGNFPSSVELCFPRPKNTNTDNACLAFWDDSKSPPLWRCQDKCLKTKSNNLCGKTDHFTNFAILLAGLPPDECDDSGGYYVTGSLKGDMLLIWLLIGFFVLVWAVLYFLCSYSKVRVYFVGHETHRIRSLR